jgi:hypothetical protein
MTPDEYLWNILRREQVDNSLSSPVRAVLQTLMPTLRGWGNQYLTAIHPSGSFAKGTANASSTDIDVFVSLRADVPNTLKEIYDKLCDALTQNGYAPRRQNVSIGIKVGNFDVDVVPAKRQANIGDDHSLYRRRADTWTKTNVSQHIHMVANCGRTYEIRALKLWRDQKKLVFPSFYLELITIEALRGINNQLLSSNVITVLNYLQSNIANRRFTDPANSNNIVSDDLSNQEKQAISAAAATSLKSNWETLIR